MLTPLVPAGVFIERCEVPASLGADIARLHNAAFAADVAFRPYSAEEMAFLLAEDGQELWVARDAAVILGYCWLERGSRQTWLEQIGVDPSRQGQGLGLALAYAALHGAGIGPVHPAGLNVSSINGAARSMYQKLGFLTQREMRRYCARQMQLHARR